MIGREDVGELMKGFAFFLSISEKKQSNGV